MKLGPGHLNILSTAIERSQVWDGEWIWISDDEFTNFVCFLFLLYLGWAKENLQNHVFYFYFYPLLCCCHPHFIRKFYSVIKLRISKETTQLITIRDIPFIISPRLLSSLHFFPSL